MSGVVGDFAVGFKHILCSLYLSLKVGECSTRDMAMNGRNMFFGIDINSEGYTSFISHEVCY